MLDRSTVGGQLSRHFETEGVKITIVLDDSHLDAVVVIKCQWIVYSLSLLLTIVDRQLYNVAFGCNAGYRVLFFFAIAQIFSLFFMVRTTFPLSNHGHTIFFEMEC